MEKFKGTPGPWNHNGLFKHQVPDCDDCKGFYAVTTEIKNEAGLILASVRGFDTDGFVSSNVVIHNANLINAAPDLLEALALLLPNIEALATEQFGVLFLESYRPVVQAKMAIAKALGGV